jgi:hypothetical protein
LSVLTIALLSAVAVASSSSAAVAAPPVAAPACVSTEANTSAAAATAKRCGQRVEVLSARSETAQVFANPDGSSTFTSSLVPSRVHRADGSWVPVDTTLRQRSDGSVAPTATVTDMSFSGGGSGPFATYRDKGATLTVGLGMSLPKPTLSGSTAVYANVLDGVDLRVTASATSFRHVLVVKTASALANPALAGLKLSVGGDVVAAPAGEGRVRFADSKGRTVAVSDAAAMWDSTVNPGGFGEVKVSRSVLDGLKTTPPAELVSDEHRPGGTAKSAPVGVRADADGHGVRLTPDAAMLKSAALPLFIDPAISPGDSSWAYSRSINSNWATNGQAWIGVNPPCCGGDGSTFRSFFDFPTTATDGQTYKGKHIISASFNIMLTHSYSCGPTVANAFRSTGTIYVGSGARMDWGARPLGSGVPWLASAAGNANEAGGCGSIQPDFLMTFGNTETMRADVQAVANAQWDVYPIGLCTCDANGANESAQDRWKRFLVDSNTKMSVTYNTVPGAPDNLSPHQGQVACNGIVGTTSPVLTARYADNDTSDTLSATFHWQQLPSGTVNSVAGPSKPANNNGSVTLNLGAAAEGKTFQFQVQTNDSHDISPWSPWCQFTVDTAAPPAPNVTPTGTPSPVYASCDPANVNACAAGGGPGTAGAFTFSEPPGGEDAIKYVYGWTSPPTHTVTVAPGAASPPVLTYPYHAGINQLAVYSEDAAGHRSPTKVFTVLVAGPTAATAYWPLDSIDGHGYTDQVSGVALATSGVSWTNDARFAGAQAATFNATGGATVTVSSLDTSGSFAVAAWVRVSTAGCSGYQTIVSADSDSVAANNHASAFALSYDCVHHSVSLRVSDRDVAQPALVIAATADNSVVPGKWVFVDAYWDALNTLAWVQTAGTSKPATGSAGPQQSWIASHGAGFRATGKVAIGRARWNDADTERFAGDIADVRLWNRVVTTDDVYGTADDPTVGVHATDGILAARSVGSWQLSDGECFCAQAVDGSVFARPLTVVPNVTLDPNWQQNPTPGPAWLVDGGHDGNGGLHLDGQAGSASTTDDRGTQDPSDDVAKPALLTDQSFSAQALVTPDSLGSTDANVLSQGTGSAMAMRLYLRGSDHKWVFAVSTPDGAGGYTWATSVSDVAAVAGEWVRLGGTFDAATGATRLVVNGAYQSTYAASGGGGWRSTGSFVVGSGNAFAGTVDEIDVWQEGHAAGFDVPTRADPTAPVGRWAGSDPAGSTAFTDNSGLGNLALATNVTFGTAGRLAEGASAAAFNGTASAAATDPAHSPPLDTARSFSASAWVKLNATGGPAQTIVSRDGVHTSAFTLGYSGPDNKWSFSISTSDVDNPTTTTLLSRSVGTAGRWTLLVATYDASTHKLTLYVDGVVQPDTTTTTGGFTATGGVAIGRRLAAGAPTGYFGGTLSDVTVWDRAISAVEVKQLAPAATYPPLHLTKVSSGQCLVVYNGSLNGQAFQYTCAPYNDQVWIFDQIAPQRFHLINRNTGYCLAATAGKATILTTCSSTDTMQQWLIHNPGGPQTDFGLAVPALGTSPSGNPYCLVIQGSGTNTAAFMWDCQSQYADQRWYLGGAPDGTDRIIPVTY